MLQKADCYFGGGTAISLMLNEYRESVDIEIIPKIIENEKNYIPLEFQLGFEQNINQSKKWTK